MLRRLAVSFFIVAIIGTLALTLTQNADAQSSPIVGAWVVTSIHFENRDDILDPEQSLIIFTEDGYYSLFTLRPGRIPVAAGTPNSDLTLEQKANAFDSLASNSGTYSIDGDTVTRHVYIRKNPIPITDFPNNGRPLRFSVENDTLTTYNLNNPNNFTVHKRANLK